MDEDAKLLEEWKSCEARHHGFTFRAFKEFCHEWDAICEKIRKWAERE